MLLFAAGCTPALAHAQPGGNPTPAFGILFLGIFVGVVLAVGLQRSGGTLRAGITALGVALGAGPVAFIQDVGNARWMYPVGLVVGLLVIPLASAPISAIANCQRDVPSHGSTSH